MTLSYKNYINIRSIVSKTVSHFSQFVSKIILLLHSIKRIDLVNLNRLRSVNCNSCNELVFV